MSKQPVSYTQALGQVEGKLDALYDEVKGINHSLEGDGQPGLKDRLTRAEGYLVRLQEISQARVTSLELLDQAVTTLAETLKDHTHAPSTLLSKEVVGGGVMLILLVQALVPEGFNLWALLTKFLGL